MAYHFVLYVRCHSNNEEETNLKDFPHDLEEIIGMTWEVIVI